MEFIKSLLDRREAYPFPLCQQILSSGGIKVSAAFICCSAVNTVPPAIVKRWNSSIFIKMSAIGRCEAMSVVRQVVFTCNADGLMRPYY